MAAASSNKTLLLFIHGLESGVNGSKARYLRQHFPDAHVLIPDLHMSALDPWKANSFLRNFFSVSRSLRKCCDLILEFLKAELAKIVDCRDNDAAFEEAASSTPVQFTEAEKVVIKRDLIVVASSWGGACGLELLERGLRPKRILLLAPAIVLSGWKSILMPDVVPHSFLADEGTDVDLVIAHGDADDTVQVEGSRELKKMFPEKVRYVEIPGGDHRLNAALIDTGRLKEMILE
eukprot:TRINITY_DN71787_c0_g1_i1.p1 TRINITY_DN71787_c0_g1~~TRINITY_DN71787_c0_g1_i1.p1  ORF type:complete len:247 (-),score=57.33 TRINITY_DN71787_c0_g1_i1:36-737(-)